ncbi:alpha/beta-hydrolase [Clavulina sp. PMI_390]|nr:alpha/beta-hydrolase [Clavulina sp. PMI_390]
MVFAAPSTLLVLLASLLSPAVVHASPLLERSTTVTAMTASAETVYTPYALFASAAYCPASETITWSCGASCSAISNFVPYGSGGDGDATQYWYVGYDSTYFNAIVVAHQGTDPSKILSIIDDISFVLEPLDSTLYPGLPSTLKAHSGFQATHDRAAPGVLAAVQKAMAATKSTHVVITGHSLGAAIALLDALYLPLHLPSGTTFSTAVFGLPRVGNPAFASYVDAHVTNFAHVTNKKDPVPIVPGRFLGFAHPSNEKHIVTSGVAAGDWYACDGQDNTSTDCSTGAVPNIFVSSESDHDGPYGAVYMGGCSGPY